MAVVFRILQFASLAWSFLILARIFLPWFMQITHNAGLYNHTVRLTDPLIAPFRATGWFRYGQFDFSPAMALLFLSMLGTFFGFIAEEGVLSFAAFLIILLGLPWSVLRFFLVMLAVLVGLRLLGILFRFHPAGPWWRIIDELVAPSLESLIRRLAWFKIRLSFRGVLVVLLSSCILGAASGEAIWQLAAHFIGKIPF